MRGQNKSLFGARQEKIGTTLHVSWALTSAVTFERCCMIPLLGQAEGGLMQMQPPGPIRETAVAR